MRKEQVLKAELPIFLPGVSLLMTDFYLHL